MSATDLQNQGRQAYKRGDFNKALEYYNRALGRQETVQLYDHRAATYEKLGDFKSALQDAKKAIRIGDVDATGYLRAGRILTKMDKSKAALDIYAYGLRHIKHVGQGFEQLKECHDDLLAELAPAHSVDPLTVLPRELATSILEFCSFRERTVICRVSKGWRRLIRSEPNLWAHLDLGAARKKVRTDFISVAINTARSKLTAATLSKLWDFDKVLTALLRTCPLETLTLAQTGMQGQNLVNIMHKSKEKLKLKELRILEGTEISQHVLRDALIACQSTLEVLHCWHLRIISFAKNWNNLAFPKLKRLNITADHATGLTPGLKQLIAGSPDLTSLTLVILNENAASEDIPQVDLRDTKLEHVNLQLYLLGANRLQLPASVRSLRLASTARPQVGFFPHPPAQDSLQLQDLPNLEDVHLDLSTTSFDQILQQFQSRLPTDYAEHGSASLSQLRSLSIQRAAISDMPGPEMMPLRLKELRSLALPDMMNLCDEKVVHIVKELPMLQSLDVSGSNITGAGVGDLVRMNRLTEIKVVDCHKIGHRDAIDYARKKGVKVIYP